MRISTTFWRTSMSLASSRRSPAEGARPLVGLVAPRRGLPAAALLLALILAGGVTTAARAQSVPDSRLALDFGGGFRATTSSFTQSITFEQYSEPGSLTSSYLIGRRPVADAGIMVRLWRHLAVGIAATYLHDSETAQVNALVPNPLVFAQPRQISAPVAVSHVDLAGHFQAAYWAQLTPHLEISISGGPSIFRVTQYFVSDVAYSQTFPYTTATFEGASVVRERKAVTGGNIAAQAGWRLARHLSVVAEARFARASVTFTGASAQSIIVGGLDMGGGIRLRF
jgi:hypothetical protein